MFKRAFPYFQGKSWAHLYFYTSLQGCIKNCERTREKNLMQAWWGWKDASVEFPAPTSGSSELPATPVPGDLTSYGLFGHLHACGTYKLMQAHILTYIFFNLFCLKIKNGSLIKSTHSHR